MRRVDVICQALREAQEETGEILLPESTFILAPGGIAWEESYGGVPVIPCATLSEWKLGGRGVSWKQSRIFEDVVNSSEIED